jgi:hypothetical protein
MIQKNFRRSFKVIILAEGEGFELKIPRCGFALQNGGSQVETHSHRKRESDDSLFLWLGLVVVFQEFNLDIFLLN